jgi:hypothetical protein
VALQVVGAGLGRTGTNSLSSRSSTPRRALLPHDRGVGRPDDIPVWQAAAEGTMPDWDALFADYCAAVDWPRSRVLARARRRVPRRTGAGLHAGRRRVVDERQRHDLPVRAAGAARRADLRAQLRMVNTMLAAPLHTRLARGEPG